MNQKDIYGIILKHNLYPWQTKTYVEPFSDGSYFFWNKPISFTQYINDVNKRICNFYLQIRNGNYDKANIYMNSKTTYKDIKQILNTQFYKRLDRTYIFDRSVQDIIKATDSKDTFFYCQIQELNNQIISLFKKISGKFLFVCKKNNLENNEFNLLNINDMSFVYNYKIEKKYSQELFQ